MLHVHLIFHYSGRLHPAWYMYSYFYGTTIPAYSFTFTAFIQYLLLCYCVVNTSTRANHALMLSVMEGGTLRLSCTSVGSPTPTIVWEINGRPSRFSTTEVVTTPQAELVGAPGGGLIPDVTPGNVTSETLIVNAQYPAENGTYTCIGSNDNFQRNDSTRIYVQVLGMSDYYY